MELIIYCRPIGKQSLSSLIVTLIKLPILLLKIEFSIEHSFLLLALFDYFSVIQSCIFSVLTRK